MNLNIKLDNYEGPFDLLLNLIKENEMDIYDIKILEITNQYLEHMKFIDQLDLEFTSEFIVMAATLMEIKSKLLLPIVKEEKDQEEIDPRQELMERLIEYKKFKLAASYLKKLEDDTGLIYSKMPEVIIQVKEEIKLSEVLKSISLIDIYNIYSALMKRFDSKQNTVTIQSEIVMDLYKVDDKMDKLIKDIKACKKLNFTKYINECRDKMEVIVTFLALLEIIRLKVVKVYQVDNFSEIYIEGMEGHEG
ncbi:MAG TPA: segregation/condensation protein A [Clostridiaceae bacterium]